MQQSPLYQEWHHPLPTHRRTHRPIDRTHPRIRAQTDDRLRLRGGRCIA